MQTQQTPQVLQQPFAAQGDKNTIPNAATGTNKASLQEGFPPITGQPINQGGIPPERQDFNGAMNLNSQFYFAFQNGWWPTFTQEVSDAIGGYPQGAVLWLFDMANKVYTPLLSLVGNNTYNFNTNKDYIGQYWAKILPDSGRGLPLGAVYFSSSSNADDNPGALPLWSGAYYTNASTLYPAFYSWVKSHTELCKTKTEYDSAISTYGECPYYVVDEVAGSLRLPKLVNYLKMANTTDGITQAQAGLPNITGTFSEGGNAGDIATGAFYVENPEGPSNRDAANDGKLVGFDASRSSAVYGGSDTVTPAHTTVFPWVVVTASDAESSATAAAQSADAAATSAINASNSAEAAENSATAAAGSASAAESSATNAQTYANTATSKAAEAASSATEAAESASAAASSASAASGSASTATTQASNAEASAELAQKWATQTTAEVVSGQGYGAKYYAEQAANSASSASTSASTATTKATEASASASQASQSAIDAANSAASARGLQIGAVYFSQSSLATDNPGALPLWTGEYYANASSLYPDFYSWVKSHTELCKTKTEYDTAISTYGECPYYVVDEVAGSLRLPKLVNYLKMANSTDGITQAQAGVPNITGYLDRMISWTDGASGAFTKTLESASISGGNTASSYNTNFDASLSSAVYGRSSTVTPAHTTIYPWVYAFNSAVSASEAQAAEFTGALVSKADTDLSNVSSNIDYVVETYRNSNTWYRVYKSGWIEQGGYFNQAANAGTINITLLKPLSKVLSLICSPFQSVSNGYAWNVVPTFTVSSDDNPGAATTSIRIDYRNSDPNTNYISGAFWIAEGQGA